MMLKERVTVNYLFSPSPVAAAAAKMQTTKTQAADADRLCMAHPQPPYLLLRTEIECLSA